MIVNDYKNLTTESVTSKLATVSAEEVTQPGGPPPSVEPDQPSNTFHCNIDQEVSGMPDLRNNPLGWA